MGRPREHDESTAEALLTAAEQVVREGGLSALTVRAVALRATTTTRAIYSVFGGRGGLLAGLGARAFQLLERGLAQYPVTDDPRADLVGIGVDVFRQQMVVEHPVLFVLGVQQPPDDPALREVVRVAADHAWPSLTARVARLGTADADSGATAYHALCEGLGAIELRGAMRRQAAPVTWRASLAPLVEGLAQQA